jgi:wobble nucleotide-excising tRNase
VKDASDLLAEKRKEISDLRKRTSSIGGAVNQINKHLEEFFGRKEIQLELDRSGLGYVIQREGEPACNLSEGEKTAIAFSYFLVKVQEAGFKKEEGVIVIDDPISSLDSNFVFHCFSLIKNNFNDAGQLFVLTHNFELFNLIKSWLRSKNKCNELCGHLFLHDRKRSRRRFEIR